MSDKKATGKRKWKKWTKKQTKILTDNYGSMPIKDLAKWIGKSVPSVRDKAYYDKISDTGKSKEEKKKVGLEQIKKDNEYMEKINGAPEQEIITCPMCNKFLEKDDDTYCKDCAARFDQEHQVS